MSTAQIVARVDEVLISLGGCKIGAQGVAAIEFREFGEGTIVLHEGDVTLGNMDRQVGGEA